MSSPARTDRELLDAHVGGDRSAFGELVRRHSDRLWAVALRTLRDREDAADAVQDALISAHRAAPGFRADASVSTWLHRIVINACIDRIRREQARPTVRLLESDPREPAAPGDAMAALHTRIAVQDALGELPAEQRVAIVLVDVLGYPVVEAAAVLEIPVGTVKSRCARGRARLAVLLGYLRNREPEQDVSSSPARSAGTRHGGESS